MTDKRSEFLAVRLTKAERAALERVAEERTASMGSVLRWAVRTAVLGESPGGRQEKNEGYANVSQAAGAPFVVQS